MGKSLSKLKELVGGWVWIMLIDMIGSPIGIYLSWQKIIEVPIWVWFVLFAVGVIGIFFYAFHQLRVKLSYIEDSLPSLFIKRTETVTRYKAHYTHIEIANKPKFQTKETIARNVVGYVEFYKSGESKPFFDEMEGIWADTPENTMGKYQLKHYAGLTDSLLRKENQDMSIMPNEMPVALSLILKYKNEDNCYAINYESCWGYYDRRNPNLALPPNDYVVRLRLIGSNTGQETKFCFDLNNPGAGKEVQLKLREKEPNPVNKRNTPKEYPMKRRGFHNLLKKASQPVKKSEKGKS